MGELPMKNYLKVEVTKMVDVQSLEKVSHGCYAIEADFALPSS
jgi:hypothetical protein